MRYNSTGKILAKIVLESLNVMKLFFRMIFPILPSMQCSAARYICINMNFCFSRQRCTSTSDATPEKLDRKHELVGRLIESPQTKKSSPLDSGEKKTPYSCLDNTVLLSDVDNSQLIWNGSVTEV